MGRDGCVSYLLGLFDHALPRIQEEAHRIGVTYVAYVDVVGM